MTDLTHNDLHRDFGKMEGRLDAMDGRLSKIEETVEHIRTSVDLLAKRDAARGAFEKAGVWIAGGVGAAVTLFVSHFWK